ncbi:DUF413 domain-containing protein [Desulfatitalea alkaliphila]|uniref:Macrodomain Ori protein n=1 Tax=Desulfatitalea alkaliphila TaxID=2929485 RepID=A0AA41R7U7_9BACT|nr:DUF413 domain-containing protein [Desulfatitalea alkaliphila]MCJ8503137.1 DUF413 domain-containing protein [Desulfatitalea alkaliphila]
MSLNTGIPKNNIYLAKKMSERKDHLKYIAMKNYRIRCNKEIFSDDELYILKIYGHWFNALTSGKLIPFTKEQERFIEVHENKLKPENEFEKAWWKYQRRIEIEESDPNISKRKYEWHDESESWFSRKDRGRMMPYGGFRKR